MRPSYKKLVTKVKPNINSVEVHPKLSNNMHPVDGAQEAGPIYSRQIGNE